MRITNKIMQNNSLYNINNNKVNEDQINTMMATGKKLTRPSDDPVIAIRALRLLSNVVQLSQYYEKNAKDATSWLDVTADAISTVTAVLTDSVKQATKGANKDLTIADLDIIVSQMDALAKEYYSTGNADYAGRYIFTGYRTDTPLSFDRITTADYTDINDEFNADSIGSSSRVLNRHLLNSATVLDTTTESVYEHQIVEKSVGRLRLSYDNLNYAVNDGNTASLKFREELVQSATSSVDSTCEVINLTYKTSDGITRNVTVPIDEKENLIITSEGIEYSAKPTVNGTYKITAVNSDDGKEFNTFEVSSEGVMFDLGNAESAISNKETKSVTTITYTGDDGKVDVKVPLLPAIGQTYNIALETAGFTATVNSDGTYTVSDNANIESEKWQNAVTNTMIQVTANGSIHSSYKETTMTITGPNILYSTSTEEQIDAAYADLASGDRQVVFNALTGEILMSEELENKLSTLPNIINTKTLDVVYDKKEWVNGDIRPENLFNCTYTDENNETILYNRGTAGHSIAYDVGFAQSVVVNTMAEEVFSTNVKRDVTDLSRKLEELKSVDATLSTLKQKLSGITDEDMIKKINAEIDAASKAYSYLREEIQTEFEKKITSSQKSLDVANIAVTTNGTRSKRLDLVNSRLMNQTTTFKTLQSDNEDIDLAEAASRLTTAQVTYEASLMATGKISQSSLMNYI